MLTLALQTDSRGVSGVLVERPKVGATRLVGVATVERGATAALLAEALRAALPQLRGGKPQVAVALGPDEIRVKRLAVPPAPEGELPPIVAMQAARDVAADVDSIVADFVPLTPTGEGAPLVLAAWATAECLDFWREVADQLGGRLTVATPRPLAMAPGSGEREDALYLSRAGESVDFVAFRGGSPVLVRSAHIADADAERELRRTLLTLSADGVADPAVSPLHAGLVPTEVASVTPLPALHAIDASDTAGYDQSLAATGLAVGTASHAGAPTLNLADPRRPPVAETGRRRQLLLAAAAASVLVAGVWMAYGQVAQLDRQIADKEKEIAAAEEEVEAFEPYRDRVAALDAWRKSDVTWLDEVERLGEKLRPLPLDSKDFPVASDIRATQLVATAFLGGDEPGGRIDLTAVARSSSTSELESRLRDDTHPVEPISTAETPSKDAYRYKYSALLRVPPTTEAEPASEDPTAPSTQAPTEEPTQPVVEEQPESPAQPAPPEASEGDAPSENGEGESL